MDQDQDVLASVPEALQGLYPFFARGHEIEHLEPVVSYFTRLYAVEQGLGVRRQLLDSAEQKRLAAFLMDEMGALESLKTRILASNKWSVIFRSDAFDYMHHFALRIFERAEREARGRLPAADTAAKFYAASIFLQALEQFRSRENHGPQDARFDTDDTAVFWERLAQQIRYAQYKCVSIRKTLREGSQTLELDQPTSSRRPGADAAADMAPKSTSSHNDSNGTSRIPAHVVDPMTRGESQSLDRHCRPTTTVDLSVTSIGSESNGKDRSVMGERNGPRSPEVAPSRREHDQLTCSPGNGVAVETRQAFRRHVRSALSAIEFDDDETAIKELQKALSLLTPSDMVQESHHNSAIVNSSETQPGEENAP
jgi:vacuolar protein sorting-associated protein VTA1